MLNKILKYGILGTVFLLPLFYLPFAFNLELTKTYFLFFAVWFLVLLCLFKMIIKDKEILVRYSKYEYFLVLFLIISGLSLAFSVDRKASIFGVYGRSSSGFLALLTFIGLYFLLTHNTEKFGEEKKMIVSLGGLVKSFLVSGFIVLILSYFSLFGVWQSLINLNPEGLSWLNYLNLENTTHISREGFAIYLSFLILISLFALFFPRKNENSQRRVLKKLRTAALILIIFASLVLLLFIDFVGAWILLGISLIVFVFMSSRRESLAEYVPRLIFPIFIIIISLIFSIFNFKALIGNPQINLPIFQNSIEALPSYKSSWAIGGNTILAGAKNTILGSGIGTFFYDLAKHRPAELAKGGWPAVSLVASKSSLAEILAGQGILGFIFYLFVLLLPVVYFLKPKELIKNIISKIKRKRKEKVLQLETQEKDPQKDFVILSLVTLLVALIISQVVYYQPVVLAFIFWVSLAVIRLHIVPLTEKRIKFKESPGVFLVVETVLIILLIFVCLGWVNAAKFCLADVNYSKGFYEADINKKIEFFDRARTLNPYEIKYLDALANGLFLQAKNELQKPTDQTNEQKIVQLASTALSVTQNETKMFPNRIVGWQTLANMYRDLIGIAKGDPATLAVNSYKKALELDPHNPYFYLEIGKIQFGQKKIDEAEDSFKKCLEIDPDFVPAKVQMALVSEQRGKTEEAISQLEEIVAQYPANIDANFHLGRLYYNEDRIDEAIDRLTTTLLLSPYHINARFSLALAFEKKGEYQKALDQLKIVEQLNPDNKLVKDKITAIEQKMNPSKLEKEEGEEQEKEEPKD